MEMDSTLAVLATSFETMEIGPRALHNGSHEALAIDHGCIVCILPATRAPAGHGHPRSTAFRRNRPIRRQGPCAMAVDGRHAHGLCGRWWRDAVPDGIGQCGQSADVPR